MVKKSFTALTVFGFFANLYFFGWHTESHYLSKIHYLLLFFGITFALTLVLVMLSPILSVVAEKETDKKKRNKLASDLILSMLGMAWINCFWLFPVINELGPEHDKKVCKLEVEGKRLEEIWCLASECFELLLQLEEGEEPRWVEPPFWRVWMKKDEGDQVPVILAKGYLGLKYVDFSPKDANLDELELCLE